MKNCPREQWDDFPPIHKAGRDGLCIFCGEDLTAELSEPNSSERGGMTVVMTEDDFDDEVDYALQALQEGITSIGEVHRRIEQLYTSKLREVLEGLKKPENIAPMEPSILADYREWQRQGILLGKEATTRQLNADIDRILEQLTKGEHERSN